MREEKERRKVHKYIPKKEKREAVKFNLKDFLYESDLMRFRSEGEENFSFGLDTA